NFKLTTGKISQGIKEDMARFKPPKNNCYPENEKHILSNWQIGYWSNPGNSVDRSLVKWHPPESNWFKLNFDGASKGNPGTAAGGGAIRDHK
ncbi:hypothetical protein KI387_029617, partial [Taxus chinensis]